jgi:hypothetical protein
MASTLKVIIAGGGIAGLTLANALEVRITESSIEYLITLSTASEYRLYSTRAKERDSTPSRCIHRYPLEWM